MSFKDLERNEKDIQPRVETPEDAAIRARAAARHRAKEEKAARSEEHRTGKKETPPGAAKGEPNE